MERQMDLTHTHTHTHTHTDMYAYVNICTDALQPDRLTDSKMD